MECWWQVIQRNGVAQSSEFQKKSPDLPVRDSDGSTAIFGGMKHPEVWSTANRSSLSVSESGQAFECLNQVLQGTDSSLLPAWIALWSKYEVSQTCQASS